MARDATARYGASVGKASAAEGVLLARTNPFNGVKVFSATMVAPRQQLGETVTAWIAANPQATIVDIVVTQSSDAQFHCIAISVFYRETIASRSAISVPR